MKLQSEWKHHYLMGSSPNVFTVMVHLGMQGLLTQSGYMNLYHVHVLTYVLTTELI